MTQRKPSILERHLLPELSLFERDEDRDEAWRATPKYGLAIGFGALWVSWTLFTCSLAPPERTIETLLQPYLPSPSNGMQFVIARGLLGTISQGIFVSLGLLGSYWVTAKRIRRSLRQSLITTGVPVCLHCGYDVRGQLEPRCPECGHEFDPKLRDLWEYLQTNRPEPTSNPQPAASNPQSPSDHLNPP